MIEDDLRKQLRSLYCGQWLTSVDLLEIEVPQQNFCKVFIKNEVYAISKKSRESTVNDHE